MEKKAQSPTTIQNILKARQNWQEKQRAKKQLREQNQEKYDKMTAAQRLKDLDMRLGQGEGAKKQRAKLLKSIEAMRRLS